MKDRIKKVIDHGQLTSSKFADIINVQRSSISHILSGRNNPSLEVVQKILTSFSTLNSEWLLFGRGAMYKNEENSHSENIKPKEKVAKNVERTEKELFSNSNDEDTEIDDTSETNEEEEIIQNAPKIKNVKNEAPRNVTNTEKIIIFNSDRTFIEYTKGE